ncbi:unnamed protein product [Staurois parvus]|uniref:Uncharacterized protein n=1 Tax=Staurois parvus TaxID=386267 RepID=A0ABN9EG08_9NEOB|nr:unnamed protein product [Staurois parvus]
MGPLCPCPNSKKPMKKVPGHLMGPPTDPGRSGSARVSKWSVRPWHYPYQFIFQKMRSRVSSGVLICLRVLYLSVVL